MKNAYIPSERNIAFIPRISSLDLTRNYLRSFLFDWLGIRTKFTKDDEIGIVDMGVKYYYNEAQKKDKLVIESNDCETEIDMEQASSGLMSITPLYAYLTYLTSWIYSHNEDRSYETDQKIKDGLRRRLAEKEINIPESVFDTYIRTHESQPITFDAKTESDNNPTSVIIQKLQAEFWRPKYSSIIIDNDSVKFEVVQPWLSR